MRIDGTTRIVDATIIHAPSSTQNASGVRGTEMHQTRTGNQWFVKMRAHIGGGFYMASRLQNQRPDMPCELLPVLTASSCVC